MATDLADVRDLLRQLQEEHGKRHLAFSRLRDFWHGRYWERSDKDSASVSSLFRDLIKTRTEIGPDIKLVHNLVQEICVKYQTFLSPLPMIQVYIDPPEGTGRRRQATLKERFLYGAWAHSNMVQKFNRIAWYLPLFGHCYVGIYPDFEQSVPCALLRSPEFAFPVQGWDGNEEAVIFRWEIPESRVARMFPNYKPLGDVRAQRKGRFGFTGFNRNEMGASSDPAVEIIEYSDGADYALYAGEQQMRGVEHNFGFNLFEPIKFIDVPDEPWGHGAVEQAVNLVEAGNALHSLVMQAFLQSVFPQLVLEDPLKFPEEIDMGLGSVLPVNAGGKAYYLTPPAGALQAHENAIVRNEQMIKEQTSMPDVNFGQFKGSIVTGKAINELQGAGTGSTIEMVQGCSIGTVMSGWNEKAIVMAQRYFREDKIRLHGSFYEGAADIKGRRFAVELKGKELVGSPRNEVVFMPTMNMHEKIVMGLQMAGAGLVSKEWQRNQVGIPDSQAMEDEIISETMRDAVLQGIVQALVNAGAPPDEAQFAEQQATSIIEGTPQPVPATTAPPASNGLSPLPGGGGLPPGGGPPGPPGPPGLPPGGGGGPGGPAPPGGMPITNEPGGGQLMTPALRMPPGAPIPGALTQPGGPPGGGAPGPGGSPEITLDDAVQAFNSKNMSGKVHGRVFLVGEIVNTGKTPGDIEVALTDPTDRQVVAHFVPSLQGRIHFIFVHGEPDEPWVEVTPGQDPHPGGPSLSDTTGAPPPGGNPVGPPTPEGAPPPA